MGDSNKRRSFIKNIALGGIGAVVVPSAFAQGSEKQQETKTNDQNDHEQKTGEVQKRGYLQPYQGDYLNRVAFPIGGMGAGMFCLEGTGAISHMSIRNKPEIFHEPPMFAAICVKGLKNGAKLLEGPVPQWKFFGQRGTGNGAAGTTYGLPRFEKTEFSTAFPYGTIHLQDKDIPLQVDIKGWSPFIPTDEDASSLPVGALEYSFTNKGTRPLDCVFSFNTKNFLVTDRAGKNSIQKTSNGFVLVQEGTKENPWQAGSFAVCTDQDQTVVDHCWFRGGWWDPLTMAWNTVRDGGVKANEPIDKNAPGASL